MGDALSKSRSDKPKSRVERAYTDLEFLRSPDARTIRILAEFLGPERRFRQHKIKDTIVFFGSARVLTKSIALKKLRSLAGKHVVKKAKQGRLRKQLEEATMDLEMSRYYEDAVKLARMLTHWSKSLDDYRRFVVCSGGGPGIMEAANKGAILAGGKSIGLNITIPTEQFANQYISSGLNFEFHYFFMRKFWFVYLAKALVIFPGGFGTMDELMEVLTLLQTRKVTKQLPLLMYGRKYWNEILNFSAMVKYKTVSPKELKLIKMVDSPEEAFRYLKTRLTRYRRS